MRNVVIQMNAGEYGDFVSFLEETGFERVVLDVAGSRFMTKPQLLWQYARGILRLALRWRELREIDYLVVFGLFSYAVKLLARLGLIRYRKLFVFAFFVHGPAWFPVCRQLARLDHANDLYLVFSRSEISLYVLRLGIEAERMIYLPYGDWGQFTWRVRESWVAPQGDYYFAGGSSNRDYAGLIAIFRQLRTKLVIVCSEANWQEFGGVDLPSNVKVFRDVPSDVFESLARGSKAGILPMKLDTGASGQSVALTLMRNSKCVIASDVGALREYVDHGITGFLLPDLAQLPSVLSKMEHEGLAHSMGQAAREKYTTQFSRQAAAAAFESMLALSA